MGRYKMRLFSKFWTRTGIPAGLVARILIWVSIEIDILRQTRHFLVDLCCLVTGYVDPRTCIPNWVSVNCKNTTTLLNVGSCWDLIPAATGNGCSWSLAIGSSKLWVQQKPRNGDERSYMISHESPNTRGMEWKEKKRPNHTKVHQCHSKLSAICKTLPNLADRDSEGE